MSNFKFVFFLFCFRKCLHWIIKYVVNVRLVIRIKTQTLGAARARRHFVTNADILICLAILYTNSFLFRNTINLRLLSIKYVKKITKANIMFFWKFHDDVVCLQCQPESHTKCSGVLTISEASKDAKSSFQLTDLEKKLTELSGNIQKVISSRTKNLNTIKEQKKKIETEVETFKKENKRSYQ